MSDYDDWAWAYDALYASRGQDRPAEAREFLEVVTERADRAPTSWLDVGCGTGAHLEELRRHVTVVGLDRSAAMLDVARGRLAGVELVEGDMRTFDLGRTFDVVSCLFSSVGHLPDGAALDLAVARMAAHVGPGGVLLVQPWIVRSLVKEDGVRDVVVATVDGDPVTRVASSRFDGQAIILDMAYSTARRDGVRTGEVHLRMPVFTQQRHLESFRAAGLVGVAWLEGRDALGRGLVVGRAPTAGVGPS